MNQLSKLGFALMIGAGVLWGCDSDEPLLTVQMTSSGIIIWEDYSRFEKEGGQDDQDALEGAEHLWLTISQVSVRGDSPGGEEAWLIISSEVQRVDLLAIDDPGVVTQLGFAELDPGTYGETRLVIDESEIIVDGESHPVMIPSGGSSGIKVKSDFSLSHNVETILSFDFDIESSLSWNQGQGYMLSPVIDLLNVHYVERNDGGSDDSQLPDSTPSDSPAESPSPTPSDGQTPGAEDYTDPPIIEDTPTEDISHEQGETPCPSETPCPDETHSPEESETPEASPTPEESPTFEPTPEPTPEATPSSEP